MFGTPENLNVRLSNSCLSRYDGFVHFKFIMLYILWMKNYVYILLIKNCIYIYIYFVWFIICICIMNEELCVYILWIKNYLYIYYE